MEAWIAMAEVPDEVQRWRAKRPVALVLSNVRGETAVAEAARTHGLTVAEIEDWEDTCARAARRPRRRPASAAGQAERCRGSGLCPEQRPARGGARAGGLRVPLVDAVLAARLPRRISAYPPVGSLRPQQHRAQHRQRAARPRGSTTQLRDRTASAELPPRRLPSSACRRCLLWREG